MTADPREAQVRKIVDEIFHAKLSMELGHSGRFQAAIVDEVVMRYCEPHRRYHNLDHILECDAAAVALPEEALPIGVAKGPVRRALLMHDIVYDTRAKDNEARSAELYAWLMGQADVPYRYTADVCAMIRATTHNTEVEDRSAKVVCDIDLMSLGYDRDKFVANTEAIRAEYDWVPHDIFCAKWIQILESFLAKPRIFYTPYFNRKYEAAARENLRLSIEQLKLNKLG